MVSWCFVRHFQPGKCWGKMVETKGECTSWRFGSSLPSILVPYPQAKDDHQEINALCAARLGAAVIVHQDSSYNGEALWNVLYHLLKNRLQIESNNNDPLIHMREAIKALAVFDSHRKIVEIIEQLI